MNILEKIIETKRQEVAALKTRKSFEAIEDEAGSVQRSVYSFSEALRDSNTGIIAEFKRRSPSKGFINREAATEAIIPGYEAAGAAALSVLTDREYFGGSLDDLRRARELASIPILRKDFIIDRYQICEARIAGADAILLIAAVLSPDETNELAGYAHALGLEVLLEIHNEQEAGHISPWVDAVGVNNRDLTTFITDTDVSKRLSEFIPNSFVKISESGISDPTTVIELRHHGFHGFLMGENFMKTADPSWALKGFIAQIRAGE